MIRGIYSSASGMLAEMIKLNNIANNIANIDTNGFKKRVSLFKANKEDKFYIQNEQNSKYIGKVGSGTIYKGNFIDLKQGNLIQTGNKLDLAIEGKGFFYLQDSKANKYITRKGNFFLSNSMYVVDDKGHYLLYRDLKKQERPLMLKEKDNLTITKEGKIFQGNKYIGNLIIKNVKDKNLLNNVSDTLFKTNNSNLIEDNKFKVKQGYLEKANVEIVQEMVKMITTLRAYEVNSNLLKTQNNTINLAVQLPITRV